MSRVLANESCRTLADYTAPALMVPRLEGQGVAAVLGELCARLEHEGRVPNSAAFYAAVMKREQLSSTCLPMGWALPHGRLPGLGQLSFTLARIAHPFAWSAQAKSSVHTVLLFAVPEMEARTYLDLICAVARLSQSSALVERLQHAPDADSMFAVLGEVSLGRSHTAGGGPTASKVGMGSAVPVRN